MLEWASLNASKSIMRNKTRNKNKDNPLNALIKSRRRQNRDIRIIITGQVGVGKSTLALNICRYADKKFDKEPEKAINENVHFLAKDFIRAASILPNHSALLLDEGILAAFSRAFQSTANAYMSKVFATMRFKKYVTIICVPVLDLLDINLRKLADVLIVCKSQGHGQAYSIVLPKFGGPVWHNTLIDELQWTRVKTPLWSFYETKKFKIQSNEYFGYASQLETKHQQTKSDDELLQDMDNKKSELYNDKDIIPIVNVMSIVGVGKDRASRLRYKWLKKHQGHLK